MQRWNDKIRSVELRELDKQAHKMIIAYFLGKFEEGAPGFSWRDIIEGGLFEFLQRLVITDLKPQVFDRIKQDDERYQQLNEWVFNRLKPILSPLGKELNDGFRNYFRKRDDTINKRILSAAHFFSTQWEFDIIERANQEGYEIRRIKALLREKQEGYYDLAGIQQLALWEKYRNFIDLCGQLRFQLRWGHINMEPRTAVLGHMLVVALLSYLFSMEIGACPRRCVNNYFTGLFHDLPEVLTRDIISPVKRSIEGLEELIKTYEREQMEKEVYNLIPEVWHEEMKMFTDNEFAGRVTLNGKMMETTSEVISTEYNSDEFNPRDGALVKAADDLGAFVEAYTSIENGVQSKRLQEAKEKFVEQYREKTIAGIRFGELYEDF
ncbi:MAG: HD domain-containing protein [Syntrophobacterales bacterium]|nr:HD domain-containing protein [Syntrophobacterales bacterium]